jgi:tripartite-type tricarboxylate transporter receptor subunit TctC
MIPRTMTLGLCTFVASSVIALASLTGTASVQNFPDRPIKLMVSTTAGASPDLIARLFAHQLADRLKTPVFVENKGGANGQIAVPLPTATLSSPRPEPRWRSIQPCTHNPNSSS